MKSAPTSVPIPGSRTVIHGIDFSGADGGGAAKIRIAERELAAKSVVAIRPRVDRNGLRRLIVECARDGREHLWRIDAPFGLARESLASGVPGLPEGREPTWIEVAEWMASFPNARAWRGAMRESSRREPKRTCDRALHTPLAPMNLRVFKQTFTVITEILLPLAREGIAIMPVSMPTVAGSAALPSTRVFEGCPASVLRHRGWPAKGYKGGGEPPRAVREEIVRLLRRDGLEIASETAVEAIQDAEGDLLDAILLTTAPIAPPDGGVPPEALLEAWVY